LKVFNLLAESIGQAGQSAAGWNKTVA
jgi:hypothetical protein